MRLPLLLLPLALSLGKSFAQSPSPSTGPSPSASISSVAASPSPSPPASPLASPSASEAGTASPSPSAAPSASASPSSDAGVSVPSTFDASQTQTTLPVVATEATTVVPVVNQGASTGSPAGAASPSPSASSAPPPAGGGGGVNGGAPPVRDPNQRFNYPQPPLPSVSATRNSNSWILSPKFKITNKPTTREFTFDITKAAAAPDGYPRQIYAVNNQFPGPLVEANEGDEVVVHLNNHLDIGASIHWHGMYQNGTAFMDGAPGVSQCPIPPGGSFTYRFKIQNQYGSYWWHSHFGNTLADGLTGGLIVHSTRDPIKRGRDFDEEVVVMIQDWMDIQSVSIVDALHTNEGYRGGFAPPQGNSILINGVGTTNCTNPDIQDLTAPCSPPAPAEIPVPVGKRVRLRVLNVGSHGMFRVSVDQHPFDLVEVDDTAVWGPSGLHEVQLTTGQRSSLIINTNQGGVGSGFFFRVNFVEACLGPFAVPQSGVGIIRYVDSNGNSPNHDVPNTQPWGDLAAAGGDCADTDETFDLKPRDAVDAPTKILETHVMSSEAGVFVNKNGVKIGNFGINNVTYQNQIGYPLLTQVQEGHAIDGELVAHATFHKMGGGDIVINNLDGPISHPFHLHGKPFMIVARGTGSLTREQWLGMRKSVAKVKNPVRRDVLEIPGGSYAVLRLYIDLPGVWPLHCHIGWHLSEGKLAAMVYLPGKVKRLDKPSDWTNLCASWGKDEIGPARRTLPPTLGEKRSHKGRRIARTGPREP